MRGDRREVLPWAVAREKDTGWLLGEFFDDPPGVTTKRRADPHSWQ
ncbi:hypothetical protein ABZ618_31305 [Streptomyces roseolus]